VAVIEAPVLSATSQHRRNRSTNLLSALRLGEHISVGGREPQCHHRHMANPQQTSQQLAAIDNLFDAPQGSPLLAVATPQAGHSGSEQCQTETHRRASAAEDHKPACGDPTHREHSRRKRQPCPVLGRRLDAS